MERTRRELLKDAGTVAAGATLMSLPAGSGALARRARRKQTVAIFGGGIAGLTAAHELAERGFDVTVYERRAWGGKARSTRIPHSGQGGREPLPGEHGWRTFFGFYENTIDTMRRIPSGSNPNGVFDHLVGATQFMFGRDGGREDLLVPLGANSETPRNLSPQDVIDLIPGAIKLDLPRESAVHFANRLGVYFSSCEARRLGQWENVRWHEFMHADRYGGDYKRILVDTLSQVLQASKSQHTSARFPGEFWEHCIYSLLGLNSNGPLFRFLDGPTNDVLMAPWLALLRSHGVKLLLKQELTGFHMENGRIAGAAVRSRDGLRRARADHYLCALPVERTRKLFGRAIRRADPALADLDKLDTGWMNGLKFFMREGAPRVAGVVDYVDSPWLLTSVSQAQFWPADFAKTYGDGRVHDCISVIVSDWTADGVLYGKPAKECSPSEVVREVWAQMKRHLNDPGRARLDDKDVVSWNIDPGMFRRHGHLVSGDPLVLPSVGQRAYRPDVTTGIDNLFLAGDYLKSDWLVANMETASFNGRRAANAVVEAAGSRESPAAAIRPYRPPEWEPLKNIDEDRYRRGLPNLLDVG